MTPHQFNAMTTPQPCTLVPDITLGSVPADQRFEDFRSANHDILGSGTPYWAIPWPGGQGLARYLLDHPKTVQDRHVIDACAGNGIVAIAAALCGARSVLAIDHDENALVAASQNARHNGVNVATQQGDIANLALNAMPAHQTLICVGDMWYSQHTGRQATKFLTGLSVGGYHILFCDAGRSFRPRNNIEVLETYDMPPATEFSSSSRSDLRICTLKSRNILSAHTRHVPRV